MNINFRCTRCGACCRNFKLSLSAAEARQWIADGHDVQLLCEAIPWPAEPPAEDPVAAYKRERSFAAASGSLPIRVIVTLVASLDEACPNLTASNECAIYDRRPAVCRIYPAERNPFVDLAPDWRSCPPEAWAPSEPAFQVDGEYVDPAIRQCIRLNQLAAIRDVGIKERICALLGIDIAAMANEGYVMHLPERGRLQAILDEPADAAPPAAVSWRFASMRPDTLEALQSVGARCTVDANGERRRYLSLFAAAGPSA